jgi:hypothetical protein
VSFRPGRPFGCKSIEKQIRDRFAIVGQHSQTVSLVSRPSSAGDDFSDRSRGASRIRRTRAASNPPPPSHRRPHRSR